MKKTKQVTNSLGIKSIQVDYRGVAVEREKGSEKNTTVENIIFYAISFDSDGIIKEKLDYVSNNCFNIILEYLKNSISQKIQGLGITTADEIYETKNGTSPEQNKTDGKIEVTLENAKKINDIRKEINHVLAYDINNAYKNFNNYFCDNVGASIYNAGDKARKVRYSMVNFLERLGFSVFNNEKYSENVNETAKEIAKKYKDVWDQLEISIQKIVERTAEYLVNMYHKGKNRKESDDIRKKYNSLGYSGSLSLERIDKLASDYKKNVRELKYEERDTKVITNLLLIRHVEQEDLKNHLEESTTLVERGQKGDSIIIHDPDSDIINLANKPASDFIPASEIVYKRFSEPMFKEMIQERVRTVFSQSYLSADLEKELTERLKELFDLYGLVLASPFDFFKKPGANFILLKLENENISFLVPVMLYFEKELGSETLVNRASIKVIKSISDIPKIDTNKYKDDELLEDFKKQATISFMETGNLPLLIAFIIPVYVVKRMHPILGKEVTEYLVSGSSMLKCLSFYEDSGAKASRPTINLFTELVLEKSNIIQQVKALKERFQENSYHKIEDMLVNFDIVLFDEIGYDVAESHGDLIIDNLTVNNNVAQSS